MSYYYGSIKDTKRTRVDWTGTQLHAAGPLPMSSAHSMNARVSNLHALMPCPTKAFAHESNKVGGRGKLERVLCTNGSPTSLA